MYTNERNLHWLRYGLLAPSTDVYMRFFLDSSNNLRTDWTKLSKFSGGTVHRPGWHGDIMDITTYRPAQGSAAHSLSVRKASQVLASNISSKGSWHYLRFFTEAFTRYSTFENPDLFVWRLWKDGQNWRTAHTIYSSILGVPELRYSCDQSIVNTSNIGFVKVLYGSTMTQYRTSQVTQWEAHNDGTGCYRFTTFGPGDQNDLNSKVLVRHDGYVNYRTRFNRDSTNWQVLTMHLRDVAPGFIASQMLGYLIEGSWPDMTIGNFHQNVGDVNGELRYSPIWHENASRSTDTKSPVVTHDLLVRPHFTAINYPRQGAGVQILAVATIRRASKIYTHFRTISFGGEDNYGIPKAIPADSEVEDDLYDKPGFFSQTWIRVSADYVRTFPATTAATKHATNAVLQVFSLYGVLGCRLFVEASDNQNGSDWVLAGQIPYMGQASTGTGCGNYGIWNYGLLSWGSGPGFEDVNFWNVKRGWGLGSVDDAFDLVPGWSVEKRVR